MNINYFLPSSKFGKGAIVAAGGILGPFGILYGVIISALIKLNRDKKMKAIEEVYSSKYSIGQIKYLYENNRDEFNRLYKLASDEFFRKYIEEQENHKKAQEAIVTMQKRINDMYEKYNKLKEKEDKHQKEITELKSEIELYEEILKNWKNMGG